MTSKLSLSRIVAPFLAISLCGHLMAPARLVAGGVTVITHGYDSDVNDWITAMANAIPAYPSFPGTNYTIYKVTLTTDGNNNFFYQWARTNGSAPSITDSGEIIVKLDWSQMAGGSAPYDISTLTVAQIASTVLLQTNAISDLGGHALVELPVHLVGHSRGGSLISEISRILGTNGVWVDQLTTLDPHPFNADGNFDPFFPTDAPVRAYANVLFADDYWQDIGTFLDPDGEPVSGAYVRQLTSLSGGYNNTSSISPNHSNVHLWYHGSVVTATPASDSVASITSSERQSWWVPPEQQGTNAGFEYSLISGGNRLGTNQPLGAGSPEISSGFNQLWDFGAGISSNRTALTSNNGDWPNLMKLDRTDTNPVAQGQSVSVKFFYQWAGVGSALINFYLDDDANPFNTNQNLLAQYMVSATGAANVNNATVAVPLAATNASPGSHSLFATITSGGLTRYLYAPEPVQVLLSQQPPLLGISQINPSQFQITVNGLAGQTIILQNSPDLSSWQPLATNILSSNVWIYTNTPAPGTSSTFYRALLAD